MYKSYWKRFFDVTIALCAFVALLPAFLFLLAALTIANRGNPFFLQPRPGKNGRIFSVLKFKTMSDRVDADGNLLPDEERLTAVGCVLRRTSLDEIPQLLNVIKGDMSLIGPRPLLVEYLPLYNQAQMHRHAVKPGITGWAQVNGRNAISWEEKFTYDLWYINHMSFKLDIQILFMTIQKVFGAEGVRAEGVATMSKFTGT